MALKEVVLVILTANNYGYHQTTEIKFTGMNSDVTCQIIAKEYLSMANKVNKALPSKAKIKTVVSCLRSK